MPESTKNPWTNVEDSLGITEVTDQLQAKLAEGAGRQEMMVLNQALTEKYGYDDAHIIIKHSADINKELLDLMSRSTTSLSVEQFVDFTDKVHQQLIQALANVVKP